MAVRSSLISFFFFFLFFLFLSTFLQQEHVAFPVWVFLPGTIFLTVCLEQHVNKNVLIHLANVLLTQLAKKEWE